MLLIVLGAAIESVGFTERARFWLAIALLVGAVIFPLGVLLQTVVSGPVPSALAILGCALVTTALLFILVGFARGGPRNIHHSASA